MLDLDTADRGSRPLDGARILRARRVRLVCAGCAVLVLGAGAAQASAATIAATKACYVNAPTFKASSVTILGSGFTPGDDIAVETTGLFGTAIASPTGTIGITTSGPILGTPDPASKAFTVTATDETVGAPVASTRIKVANLAISVKPGNVKNVRKDKVTFTFSGFRPGKNIYGFYARRKIVARSNFGKAKGVCGLQRRRALLFPGGRPRANQYKVTFESQKRYSKRANPRVTGTLNIFQF